MSGFFFVRRECLNGIEFQEAGWVLIETLGSAASRPPKRASTMLRTCSGVMPTYDGFVAKFMGGPRYEQLFRAKGAEACLHRLSEIAGAPLPPE